MHLLRHGEVHNPGKILYGRLPGFRLSDDRARRWREHAAEWFAGSDVTHLVSSPLERAQQTAAPIAEALSPAGADRRAADRGRQRLRGPRGRRRRRRPARARALVEAAQPVPALVGRALRRDRRADARRRRGRPRRRPRARGRPRQPPAADLDAAAARRGTPVRARPAPPAVRPGQRHVGDLRRRPDGRRRLRRAGRGDRPGRGARAHESELAALHAAGLRRRSCCARAARPAPDAVDVNNGGEFRFVAGHARRAR